MSITTETNRTAELTTDGSETGFDFSLLIHADTEVEVWYKATGGRYSQLTLNTHYTVVFTESGGTVTTIGNDSPYAAGVILIIRNIAFTQQTNWLYNDNHSEQQHQDDFDRSVMRDLQIQEQLARSPKFLTTSSTVDITFPEPVANEIIGWNAGGTDLANISISAIAVLVADEIIAGTVPDALTDLSDVTITTPVAGDLLRYDGAAWVNYPDSNYQPIDTVLTDLSDLTAVADNEFIVGTGAGVYAHEGGNTARTSLALGTGDSPTFSGLALTGKLTVTKTTQQLELEYDGSKQADFTVNSVGDLTITVSGGDISFVSANILSTGTGRFDGGIGIGIDATAAVPINIEKTRDGPPGGLLKIAITNLGTGDVGIGLFAGENWLIGIDNSDANSLKFGTGNEVGGEDRLVITTAGAFDFKGGALTITGTISGGGSGHDQFSDFVANEHFDTSTLTAGSVIISDGTTFVEDNVGLFFATSTNRLGIGTNVPDKSLEMRNASPVIRLRDTGATADATTAFIEFGGTDAGNWVRTGWVGDGSSGSTDISLRADIGDLLLADSSGVNVTLSGGDATFAGTINIGASGKINFRDTDISIGSTLTDGILDITADFSIDMFFDNADVGAEADGQSLNINRRAVEGDDYISLYVNKDKKGLIGFSGDDDLLELAANALTVNGTIGSGEITVANGSSINLQEALTFTGATTENLIEMPDALADALSFKEGANSYLTFVTSNGSEKVTFGKVASLITGTTIGNLTLADGSITDSGGAISFGNENLTTTGFLGVGIATASDKRLNVEHGTSATSGNQTALHFNLNPFPGSASTANYRAIAGVANYNGNTADMSGYITVLRANPFLLRGGSVTGRMSIIDMGSSGLLTGSTGDIADLYYIYGEAPIADGSGTITNAAYIYLNDIGSAATNNWVIYSAGGDSFHTGDLAFGQTDKAERIGSDADGTLDLYAGTSIGLNANTIIGSGAAGVDYTLTFDGESSDGVLTWMEDELRFDFSSHIQIQKDSGVAPFIKANTTRNTDGTEVYFEANIDSGGTPCRTRVESARTGGIKFGQVGTFTNHELQIVRNSVKAIIVDTSGNVTISDNLGIGIAPTAGLSMGNDKLIALDTNAGITASTTQSQGQGALTAQVNEISTVANDGDTVTLPPAVTGVEIEIINNGVNTLQIFPASGDDLGLGANTSEELEANERVKFVAYDNDNWAKESTTEIIHAEIHDEDNTDAFVINDAGGDFHSYHTNGLVAGDLADWTFDAGGAGTSHAITGIVQAGSDITVTTGDAHGLAVGDIISQTNLADAAYVGVFDVLTVPTTTTYTVTAAYTATGTGTMDQAATLEADAVAAGVYSFFYSISATPVGNNETFDFRLYKEATAVAGSKIRRKFGAANDFGSMAGGAVAPVANGDKISFALSNEDSAANLIVRNLTIILTRL